ncbi:MAG: hypothetical protein WC843_05915 [Candidatus Gracilibacteria bacterium]|jgi:hypothetical protein
MKKLLFILGIGSVLILAACSAPGTTKSSENKPTIAATDIVLTQSLTQSQTEQPTQTAQASQTETQEVDPYAPILKGKDIYCSDLKVGKFENGRIYMKLYDQVVSVAQSNLSGPNPGIAGLNCEYEYGGAVDGKYEGFSYQGLEVSPRMYPPYGVNQTIETPAENAKITYKCDGSLAKKAGANYPNFYCETNGKDALTQYEFSAADGYPILTTGADYGESWDKIYIKKVNGLNYIFRGGVSFDDKGIWSSDQSEEKYNMLTAKTYLDDLLKAPEFTKSMALWKPIVDSFKVESADLLK